MATTSYIPPVPHYVMNDGPIGSCSACLELIKRNEQAIEKSKLWDALKNWRYLKTQEKGLNAAYMVASNRTLRDIVASRPLNKQSMLEIHGIGETRFNKFDFDSLFNIIKHSEDELKHLRESLKEQSEGELPPLKVECDVCREGCVQAYGSPPPNNDLHISSGGSNSCPTCGKSDWDGVYRNTGGYGIKPLPNPEAFYIKQIDNTDLKDGQLDDNAHKNEVLDIEIRGFTLEILSRIVDHYLEHKSVGRVFAFRNSSSSFIYTPELISGPLTKSDASDPGFVWRCRFSHTTNNGSCNSCGDALKNQSHHLCYPCWKKENRG